MFTISSVTLPIPVDAAASSNGLTSANHCSTASTLSLSTPKSKRAAPSVAPPSNIFIIPEGTAAAIDSAQLGWSSFSVIGVRMTGIYPPILDQELFFFRLNQTYMLFWYLFL